MSFRKIHALDGGIYMRCSACKEVLIEGADMRDHDCHISDRETATRFPFDHGCLPPNKKIEIPDLAALVKEQQALAADFRERNEAVVNMTIWQQFQDQKMRDIYGVKLPEEVTRALSIKDDVVSPDRSVSKAERVKALAPERAISFAKREYLTRDELEGYLKGLGLADHVGSLLPKAEAPRLDPVLKAEACSFDEMIEAVRAKNKEGRHPMSDLKNTDKELAAKRARMGKSNYFDAPEVTDHDE